MHDFNRVMFHAWCLKTFKLYLQLLDAKQKLNKAAELDERLLQNSFNLVTDFQVDLVGNQVCVFLHS